MYQAVFAFPIHPGKTETLLQCIKNRRDRASDIQFQKDRFDYRSEMGWTNLYPWIQKLPEEDFQIVLLQSKEPIDSEHFNGDTCSNSLFKARN